MSEDAAVVRGATHRPGFRLDQHLGTDMRTNRLHRWPAALAWLCAACIAQAQDLAITNARLIDGTGAAAVDGTTIVVRDGRIAAVGRGGSVAVPEGMRTIDAAGKVVMPGLADMHVHFSFGAPMQRRADETEAVLARELYYGVTSILQLGATEGDVASIRALRARREAGTLAAPYIYASGGHLTLPGTHPVYTIFPPEVRAQADRLTAATPADQPVDLVPLGLGLSFVRNETAARQAVRERAEGGMDAIKITVESGPMPFGDDHPLMPVAMIRAIVDEAHARDLPVFAHISSPNELEAVMEGGVDAVVHAVIDRPLPDATVAARMAANGLALVPTLTLNDGAVEYATAPGYMDDPFFRATVGDAEIAALRGPFAGIWRQGWDVNAGGEGGDRLAAMQQHRADVLASVGTIHAAGVPVVLGTDTGNPYVYPGYSVHRELELLVQAGLTPMQAIEAGTRRAAEMLRKQDEFGTIAPGRRADLLLLDADPLLDIRNTRRIDTVVAAGVVVDREALLRVAR